MNLGVFKRRVDVDAEIQMTPLKSLYASNDKDAHIFELSLYRGAQEMDLSGASAQGYFIRADGYTVPITGAISGNVVTLTLSESCYYVVGNFNLIIKVSIGESRKSVFWGNGYVVRSMTDAIVDERRIHPGDGYAGVQYSGDRFPDRGHCMVFVCQPSCRARILGGVSHENCHSRCLCRQSRRPELG